MFKEWENEVSYKVLYGNWRSTPFTYYTNDSDDACKVAELTLKKFQYEYAAIMEKSDRPGIYKTVKQFEIGAEGYEL